MPNHLRFFWSTNFFLAFRKLRLAVNPLRSRQLKSHRDVVAYIYLAEIAVHLISLNKKIENFSLHFFSSQSKLMRKSCAFRWRDSKITAQKLTNKKLISGNFRENRKLSIIS